MMTPRNRSFALAFLLSLAIWNFGTGRGHAHEEDHEKGHEHSDQEAHEEGHEENFVALSAPEIEAAAITLQIAGAQKLKSTLPLIGEVIFNEDSLVHVVPRFAGIVRMVGKKVGDEVKAGEVLAVVQSNESLSPYEIKAPSNGTLITKHLILGELVKDDREIYNIADLSEMWVKVSLHPQDLERVKVGSPATVTFRAGDAPFIGEARVSYLSPQLDETTRQGEARLVLSNPARRWKHGMFVSVDVVVSERAVPVAVPVSALAKLKNEQTVVFVKSMSAQGKEGFAPRPIQVGAQDAKYVEVLEGLSAGEEIAADNGFILKAELEGVASAHAH